MGIAIAFSMKDSGVPAISKLDELLSQRRSPIVDHNFALKASYTFTMAQMDFKIEI